MLPYVQAFLTNWLKSLQQPQPSSPQSTGLPILTVTTTTRPPDVITRPTATPPRPPLVPAAPKPQYRSDDKFFQNYFLISRTTQPRPPLVPVTPRPQYRSEDKFFPNYFQDRQDNQPQARPGDRRWQSGRYRENPYLQKRRTYYYKSYGK